MLFVSKDFFFIFIPILVFFSFVCLKLKSDINLYKNMLLLFKITGLNLNG